MTRIILTVAKRCVKVVMGGLVGVLNPFALVFFAVRDGGIDGKEKRGGGGGRMD